MLCGRDREREQLRVLLEDARASRSAALVIRGEPGVGKTALLQDTRDRATDMHVLTARGVESESELPFAALHQLFHSSLRYAERLPAPQAAALNAALGLADGQAQERFLVSAACLSLLSELAERRPVLCLIDDAHWLDTASADALLFVARRLDAEGVVMLFGAREGDVRTFEARDVPSLYLQGLDAESSATLLVRGGVGVVSPAVVQRIVEQTRGNALALLELPTALTPQQLTGGDPLPEALPLTDQMESVFLERVRRLAEPTRQLLLVAAADESGDLGLVLAAARTFDADVEALNAAEQAKLVSAHGTRLDFRHPLVRSALYGAATAAERRAAHLALAEAVGDHDPDRRAWHLASAELEHDEGVARLVEEVAERAQTRGGYASAARAFERAAELSPDESPRTRRWVAATRAAAIAGQDERAVALAQRVLPLTTDGAQRAELVNAMALAEVRRGRPPAATPMLIDAARSVAPTDPAKALEFLARASAHVVQERNLEVVRELGQVTAELVPPERNERSAFLANLLDGSVATAERDVARGAALLGDALEWGSASDDVDDIFLAALAASWFGDFPRFEALLARTAAIARERGQIGALSEALSFRGALLSVAQRYDEASIAAEEALQLAGELGAENFTAIPRNVLSTIAAVRGDFDAAMRGAKHVLEQARTHGLPLRAGAAQWTLGLVELGQGRWAEALRFFDAAVAEQPVTFQLVVSDRLEAAGRAGQTAHAEAILEEFEAWARVTPAARWAPPRAASFHGLLTGGAEATEHFERAIELAGDARPFDRARIYLLYGEHLRRERRRSDARVQLRAALDAFDALRAAPWSERAAAELRATGETARKRDPSTVNDLTAKEIQIARLVVSGLSNKEIAAQLFLSPRTIDYHLRNVFTKLGLTSRTQLAHVRLGDDGAAVARPVAAPA
jgi:DNA-binding CsgD family transcriptional regulator